jgi:hypothetical protein
VIVWLMTSGHNERIDPLSSATARIARFGAHVPAQLPTISVTSGRRAAARFLAHRYQVLHGFRASSQERGI